MNDKTNNIKKEATIYDYNRLCSFYTNCIDCQLYGFTEDNCEHPADHTPFSCVQLSLKDAYRDGRLDQLNSAILKWCDTHPIKTYADDFFEKFPDAVRSPNTDIPTMCVQHVYPGIIEKFGEECPNNGTDTACKICWKRKMI